MLIFQTQEKKIKTEILKKLMPTKSIIDSEQKESFGQFGESLVRSDSNPNTKPDFLLQIFLFMIHPSLDQQ